ncbi:MAG: AraC family transcriptional regulator [Clostridium sp.]|nr:AraC family transcriptional regulator [Clostridium sp.]
MNNNENIDLFEKCETLKTKIIDNTQYSVSIGLGGIKKHIWEIHTSYKESLDALKYRVTVGNNIVILYDHINIGNNNNNIYNINELNEKMSFYLKSGLYDKAAFLVNQYFENINLNSKNTLKNIRVIAMNIIAINFKTLIGMGIDNTDEIYNSQIALFNELLLLDTLPDTIKFLHKIIFESIKTINAQQTRQIDDIIIKAKKYIDDNLSDNELSLSLIAKHLYLNPSYLSRMFKKEIGISFVEYLTKIRMEKAIELLKEGYMKAFEIADRIGISDPNYFSTCFKKYTSLSISQYKKIINNSKLKDNGYVKMKSSN